MDDEDDSGTSSDFFLSEPKEYHDDFGFSIDGILLLDALSEAAEDTTVEVTVDDVMRDDFLFIFYNFLSVGTSGGGAGDQL